MNKSMVKSSAWFLVVLMSAECAFAQDRNSCLQLIRAVNNTMMSYFGDYSGKTLHVDYTVSLKLKGEARGTESHTKLFANGKVLKVVGDQQECLSDARQTIIVDRTKKLIVIKKSPLENMRKLYRESLLVAQDSLLDKSTVMTFESVMRDHKEIAKKVVLAFDKITELRYGVSKLEFVIDTVGNKMISQKIMYAPGAGTKISSMTILYHNIDYNYKGSELSDKSDIRKQIFNGSSLAAKYSGFSVHDLMH